MLPPELLPFGPLPLVEIECEEGCEYLVHSFRDMRKQWVEPAIEAR